jgi:hypothetical protein
MVRGVISAVFMTHLLFVWRWLKLLSDDATEYLQGSLSILFGKRLPQPPQAYPLAAGHRWRKKAPCSLGGMALLLECCYDRLGTNPRASKKRELRLPESQRRVDSG